LYHFSAITEDDIKEMEPDTFKNLAILPDFREEEWFSMNLCAEFLQHGLKQNNIDSQLIDPAYKKCFERIPLANRRSFARNADRLLNRFLSYPLQLRKLRKQFSAFHVVDHSYSQLIHHLPQEKTGVYCHDLDVFRCLLDPKSEPRPKWFRLMSRRILQGFQKAAIVFHNSNAVKNQIIASGIINPAKLIHAPLGVAEEFTTDYDPTASNNNSRIPGPHILHVGSCIPRKRVDYLLKIFARLTKMIPEIALIKVGGEWSREHRQMIEENQLRGKIVHRHNLTRMELAETYRNSPLTLIPSEAEGFGLPVIEALACGSVVIASDIPAMREAGGNAALYAPVGDIDAWVETIMKVFHQSADVPKLQDRLEWVKPFTWKQHAKTIASAYQKLLNH
jgi:glycosyltransferase involved in cell wall biosynthesis